MTSYQGAVLGQFYDNPDLAAESDLTLHEYLLLRVVEIESKSFQYSE